MDIQGNKRRLASFVGGATVGELSGLIGLGGAGFRLPLLIGLLDLQVCGRLSSTKP